jgi:phage protein D
MWIDNRTLYTQARSRRNHGSVTFTYGRDLVEFHVLADLAQQRSAVRVSGWDVGNKEAIDVQADRNTIQSELGDRRSGSSVLQALTAHTERIASSEPLSRQEAQSLAEARYRQRARSFVRGEGIAEGTPRLRVGTTIELRNIGPYFEGPYYVTLARHTFDPLYGYRTHFQVERPGLGGAR